MTFCIGIRCCRYRLKNFQRHNFLFRLQTFRIRFDVSMQWALDVLLMRLLLLFRALTNTKYISSTFVADSICGTIIMQNGIVDTLADNNVLGSMFVRSCRIPPPNESIFHVKHLVNFSVLLSDQMGKFLFCTTVVVS